MVSAPIYVALKADVILSGIPEYKIGAFGWGTSLKQIREIRHRKRQKW